MTRRRLLFLFVVVVVGVAVAVFLVTGRYTSDRPRELDMTAVPPCELISRVDLVALDQNVRGMPDDFSSEFGEEGTGCRFIGDPTSVDVKEVTNYGVDRWIDDDYGVGMTFEDVARIERFRVIRVMTRTEREITPDSYCRLYVDVADEQSLKVMASSGESGEPACEVAHRAAEAAMRTLIDQAGPAKR